MKRFGVVAREARMARGWSLREAAELLGTFKGYVCGIETGTLNPPSPKMIRKMAKVYGISYQDLLARSIYEKLPKGMEVARLYDFLGDVLAKRTG